MYCKLILDLKDSEPISSFMLMENIKTYNKLFEEKAYLYVSSHAQKEICILAIVLDSSDMVSWMREVRQMMRIPGSKVFGRELTLKEAQKSDSSFARKIKHYLESLAIYEYDLESLARVYHYEEGVFANEQKAEMQSLSLKEELKRIQKSKQTSFIGHPVHYIISSENETDKPTLGSLLNELHTHHRLPSQKIGFVDLRVKYSQRERDYEDGTFLRDMLKDFSVAPKMNLYGTIVVDLRKLVLPKTSEIDLEQLLVKELFHYIQPYRNKVLLIFSVTGHQSHLIELLKNMGNLTFVELTDELSYQDAASYLQDKAKQENLQADEQLLEDLSPQIKTYSLSELNQIFENWQDYQLNLQTNSQYTQFFEAKGFIVGKGQAKGSAYEELHQMIGLQHVKESILQIVDYAKVQKLRKNRGLSIEQPAQHMIFSGSPGTAKTTVARLFARILKENGVLPIGNLIEVGRADLIGKYTGWTAKIVREKFEEAKGSVLFIDEAYSLVEQEGSYGDEAINTIVQEMENHREDVIVIFAGYPDKMEEFIESNPGLRSRISFHLRFDDYRAEELFQIFELMLQKQDLVLDEEAVKKVKYLLEEAKKIEDFGNGRFVRTLIEKARMKQASRLLKKSSTRISNAKLKLLRTEDFEMLGEQNIREERKIGFRKEKRVSH